MNTVSTWFGRPVAELSREELLEVVDHCGKEILALRAERGRMAGHVDWLGYLTSKPDNSPGAAISEPEGCAK